MSRQDHPISTVVWAITRTCQRLLARLACWRLQHDEVIAYQEDGARMGLRCRRCGHWRPRTIPVNVPPLHPRSEPVPAASRLLARQRIEAYRRRMMVRPRFAASTTHLRGVR